MTAEFNELGIRFFYPDNWELSCEEGAEWPKSVSVHSPTGAFWSVSEDRRDPLQMADEVLEAMRLEYQEFESEPVERVLDGRALRGYELHFCCLDLLVEAHILTASRDGISQVLLYQAESREFDKLVPVFDAISFSFLRAHYGESPR